MSRPRTRSSLARYVDPQARATARMAVAHARAVERKTLSDRYASDERRVAASVETATAWAVAEDALREAGLRAHVAAGQKNWYLRMAGLPYVEGRARLAPCKVSRNALRRLLSNACHRRAEGEEHLERDLRQLASAIDRACANRVTMTPLAVLELANHLLRGHDVEHLRGHGERTRAVIDLAYVNMGDPYVETLIFMSRPKRRFYVSDWASILETFERRNGRIP